MYVCMYVDYGHHLQQSADQPGMVANPARGQLKREKSIIFPCPRSHMKIWLCERDRSGRLPSRVSRLHTQAESVNGAYSRGPPAFRDGVHLFIPVLSTCPLHSNKEAHIN